MTTPQIPHLYNGEHNGKHWFTSSTVDHTGEHTRYFIPVGKRLNEAEQAAVDAAKQGAKLE